MLTEKLWDYLEMILEWGLLMAFLKLWSYSVPTSPLCVVLCEMTSKRTWWFYTYCWGYELTTDKSVYKLLLVLHIIRFTQLKNGCKAWLTTSVLLPDVQARTHTYVVTCQVAPRIAMQLVEQKGCKVMRFSGKIFLHVAHLGNSRLGICSSITENMISNTIYLCNISSILKMLQGIS